MSTSAGRRSRLLRLRIIEHRSAAARLVAADSAHAAVANVGDRVTLLRDGISISTGSHHGHALQSLCELSGRLDRARIGLLPSLAETRATRNARDVERFAAHIAEERTARVHARASQREAIAAEIRTESARPPRHRKAERRP
jgi:hypothetical protein